MMDEKDLQIKFLALDHTQTTKSRQRIKKKGELMRENQIQNDPCQTCTNIRKENIYYSGLIETYQAKLREAEEKAVELRSCLSQKDAEIDGLRLRLSEQHSKVIELGGESVSAKITELAKKNKQLCVQVERERTISRQSQTRIKALEEELDALKRDEERKKHTAAACCKERETIKLLQEKLTASEKKATEQRNKVQSLQKELKVAHKVVISEVGKDVSFQKLLNCPVGFKGRAQEIQTLQLKVQELEKQLKERTDHKTNAPPVKGKWNTGINRHEERSQSKLQDIQKERRAATEKLSADYEDLKTDHNKLKKTVEVSRARNMCLMRELKMVTDQFNTLRVKTEHDDELIEAFVNQEKCLRELLKKAYKENAERKNIIVRSASTCIQSKNLNETRNGVDRAIAVGQAGAAHTS